MLKLCIVLAFVSLSFQATWYISPFGNNNNSGTTPTSPFFDLKKALSVANDGDTIKAASGYYSGSTNVQLTISGIHLVGSAGSAVTVFQGSSTSSTSSYIFTLTNGATVQVKKFILQFIFYLIIL